MSKRKRKSSSGPGTILANLLLWNILPLGALAVIGLLHWRGDIQIREAPKATTQTFAVLGGALVALFVVASLSLPAAHGAVVRLRGTMGRSTATLSGRESGSKFLALLALPFLFLAYLVMWFTRLVLTLLSFALIAVIVVFMIRLFQPEFLNEHLEKVLAWRPSDWGL